MILKGISLIKGRTTKGYSGSRDPFYQTKEWKQDAKMHLTTHPLCVLCETLEQRVTVATVSDHIIPIKQGGDKWDWKNRQGLCNRHNAIKTALDNPNNQ